MECLALQGFPPSLTFPSTVSMREQQEIRVYFYEELRN